MAKVARIDSEAGAGRAGAGHRGCGRRIAARPRPGEGRLAGPRNYSCVPRRRSIASAPSWPKSKEPSSAPARFSTPTSSTRSRSSIAPLRFRRARRRQLLDAAADSTVPLLPGAATASEAMLLLGARLSLPEILPRRAGGRRFLSLRACLALAADPLLPDRRHHARHRARPIWHFPMSSPLAAPGWRPKKLLAAKDWASIEVLSREAAQLKR